MLTLQSSKSRIVYLLIFKVKLNNYGYNVLLTSQGVSFTKVQKGLIVRWEVSALHLYFTMFYDYKKVLTSIGRIIILHVGA